MSTSRHIDKICIAAVIFAVIFGLLFINGESFGLVAQAREIGYESRIFDNSRVHSLDIVMDGWDSFIETCENEEYSTCAVVIDGEAYRNVAIRAKGNTSLSNVRSMNSDRYSFKIEFDHYDNNTTYYGLDKLVLNNIIQDNTYMKDFLVYTMMHEFGVAAPLCSFIYITVNGEDWGLYLAVEAVEDSFALRNYNSAGELYKPDGMNMGGGRGNGKNFNMEDIEGFEDFFGNRENFEDMREQMGNRGENGGFTRPNGEMTLPEGMPEMPRGEMTFPEGMPQMPSGGQGAPNGNQRPSMGDKNQNGGFTRPDGGNFGGNMGGGQRPGGGFGGGMGSSDVKLQYIDDDPTSYSNIFGSAKTNVTEADKARLIESLKSLSAYESLESVLDMEQVISYFVVHNFVNNGDSYTGSMIHNYYLHEENGALSMIPWDYNLAFGTFQSSNATSSVNSPIDSPVSGGIGEDRPMVGWIFSSEEYTELYHEYFGRFTEQFFESGYLEELIDDVAEMIAPYVEKDPTKFCTYEDFLSGVDTIQEYCLLRAESVRGQLDGSIPSTAEGQAADSSALIDASHITISDMGTMGRR